MKFSAILLVPFLALAACTTSPESTADPEGVLPAQWPRSPALEASWGPARGPSMVLNGSQAMTYLKPGGGGAVIIAYEGKNPRFPEIRDFNGKRASDGKMTVMGQVVDFYGSGNEDAEISTQPMQLTNPSGETGWFAFSFSSDEHLQGKNIPAFTW